MKNSYRTILNLQNIDFGLLIMRIAFTCSLLTHGFPKFLKFFGPDEIKFGDPLGFGELTTFSFAVFAEFFCSLFVLFGFLTRIATIPIIITMAIVVFVVWLPEGFGKMEMPFLYLSAFTVLLITGGGKYSVDFLLEKGKK
ncbi:DoxX family protein [Christiangramia fulva]|uniref:DoxX family protein n=1 Tax=Christiangramia fulva TaxID=2126553 RepID=A0A2R3Z7T4_9FLAO|nr:DoxX family protein [Christiangramia fulva]AVR46331.1 DoxX family protein [Christiangramia fulva]